MSYIQLGSGRPCHISIITRLNESVLMTYTLQIQWIVIYIYIHTELWLYYRWLVCWFVLAGFSVGVSYMWSSA